MTKGVVLHKSKSVWLFVPKSGSCSIRVVLCGALGIKRFGYADTQAQEP